MVAKKLMIAGLRKQQQNLSFLLGTLESKESWDSYDYLFCDEQTKKVSRNLRALRDLEKSYLKHHCGDSKVSQRTHYSRGIL